MKHSFVFIFFVAVVGLNAADFGASQERSTSWYWRRGLETARNLKTDSALYYLNQAFEKGIKDDSLYYLWAEIYLYRSVPDTALALSFSIKPSAGSALNTLALKQRYAIYNMLGWDKQAGAILDSLRMTPSGRLRMFIPECNLFVSGGGFLEKNEPDQNYPYPHISDSTAEIENGAGIASMRLGWRVPAGKIGELQLGGRLRYAGSRFSAAASAAHVGDSADAAIGGYIRYSIPSGLFSVRYICSRKKDFTDAKSFLHEVSFRYPILTNTLFGSIEGGYHYEFPIREHYYYLMSYTERDIGEKARMDAVLYISGMKAKPYYFDESVPYIFVKEGVIYKDSSFTMPIRTSIELLQESAFGRIYNRRVIPQSYFGINPQLRFRRNLTGVFSAGAGAGYMFCRYLEDYRWLDLRYALDEVPARNGIRNIYTGTESFLALNGSDNRYYWVRAIPSLNQVELDTLAVSFNSVKRVDHTLSLNIFFNCSFRRAGSIMLDITGRRNFSTLLNSAPVDIQKWYLEVMLSWFFRFKPDGFR